MKTPKLGQHFLTDFSVVEKMVDFANLKKSDTVLEIGPGKGVLTEKLIKTGASIVAIEKDEELYRHLKKKFDDQKNFQIILGDIRSFNYSKLPPDFKIIANIPYYLTGQLISSLTELDHKPSQAILMIQKEVAKRLTAPRGSSSLLQLTTLVSAEVEKVIDVPKEKFLPPPKVDSSVVAFNFRKKPLLPLENQKVFFRILKFAFSGKRKKISNTLGSALKIEKKYLERLLKEQSISENTRPQDLGLEEWITLYNKLPLGEVL